MAKTLLAMGFLSANLLHFPSMALHTPGGWWRPSSTRVAAAGCRHAAGRSLCRPLPRGRSLGPVDVERAPRGRLNA